MCISENISSLTFERHSHTSLGSNLWRAILNFWLLVKFEYLRFERFADLGLKINNFKFEIRKETSKDLRNFIGILREAGILSSLRNTSESNKMIQNPFSFCKAQSNTLLLELGLSAQFSLALSLAQ